MRARGQTVALFALGVVALTGTVVAAAGAPRSETHLTHDHQVAAKAATSAFRAQITRAGQQLSARLVGLDASLSVPGGMPDARDLAQAQAAFDTVRVQMVDPSAASTQGGAPSLDAALWSPDELGASHAALAQAAPVLTVVLGRVVLSPQAIAQSAQRSTAWISRMAPSVTAGTSPLGRSDLEATARAVATTMVGLADIGRLVDPPESTAAAVAAGRLVDATSSSTTSLRQIITDADVLSVHLGRLGGALTGYGKGSLYQ